MSVRLDWYSWLVGVVFLRNVPMASDRYLCDHYEQCIMLRVGPLSISYWFRLKAARSQQP